ncbi:hypothetical protein B0T17DRAFT_309536 [Bombardia bombarda]|uniref:Uncharacterized protein n=1 Tax=Bombardia bombarda TaxID=252184 RepID=A0AA39WUX4_9PEZI|nr:hypothetical protein B0T17DRAFT_309536 [Bombardia bombarda]
MEYHAGVTANKMSDLVAGKFGIMSRYLDNLTNYTASIGGFPDDASQVDVMRGFSTMSKIMFRVAHNPDYDSSSDTESNALAAIFEQAPTQTAQHDVTDTTQEHLSDTSETEIYSVSPVNSRSHAFDPAEQYAYSVLDPPEIPFNLDIGCWSDSSCTIKALRSLGSNIPYPRSDRPESVKTIKSNTTKPTIPDSNQEDSLQVDVMAPPATTTKDGSTKKKRLLKLLSTSPKSHQEKSSEVDIMAPTAKEGGTKRKRRPKLLPFSKASVAKATAANLPPQGRNKGLRRLCLSPQSCWVPK